MIYDISQELFSGAVYPGDRAPEYKRVLTHDAGDGVNLTEVYMNAHNATHIDAPIHMVNGGKAIEELDLNACVGTCEVISYNDRARIEQTDSDRILFSECDSIDKDTAELLVKKGIRFLGVEGQSVGTRDVHIILLEADVVILEGARLKNIPKGKYFLSAAPIKLGGSDGAPCRAILVDL